MRVAVAHDVVTRRRALAIIGAHQGDWSHEIAEAAFHLALRVDIPASDEAWIGLLRRLDARLHAVTTECREEYHKSIGR